jgi:hypothetical protein
MKENKESYTAYNGSQIWNTIYQENCLMERVYLSNLNPVESCSEETLLYQAVSGLHASVNMHISHQYVDIENNLTYPNHQMYFDKIGGFEDRLKNLHFVYALVLRALNKVQDQLLTHDYSTGVCFESD